MNVRLALLALVACAPFAFAQAPDPCATNPAGCATLIEARATSHRRIPNTVVDVSVGLSVNGKDMAEVERNLAERSNALLPYLRAQKVERLTTARVSFSPETRYDKSGPEKTVGYTGSAHVLFRTTPDKLAELLAGVLSNGANSIESTTFTATENEIDKVRQELSAEATKTAIAEAGSIASAAGLKVVAIRTITVDAGRVPQPVPYPVRVMSLEKASAMQPVETAPGEGDLSVQVSILAAASR